MECICWFSPDPGWTQFPTVKVAEHSGSGAASLSSNLSSLPSSCDVELPVGIHIAASSENGRNWHCGRAFNMERGPSPAHRRYPTWRVNSVNSEASARSSNFSELPNQHIEQFIKAHSKHTFPTAPLKRKTSARLSEALFLKESKAKMMILDVHQICASCLCI